MMDEIDTGFFASVRKVADRQKRQLAHATSEEATKHFLVMPVLVDVLGYDVTRGEEVQPEFTADVGVKRGEKVDYAIMHDSAPAVLIECKSYGTHLSKNEHTSQLFRYFTAASAPFAVLTDGVLWWFFTDLDAKNKMDPEPFLTFDFKRYRDADVDALQRFTKDNFDVERNREFAFKHKMYRLLLAKVRSEWESPSREFISILTKGLRPKPRDKKERATLEELARVALQDILGEKRESMNATLAEGGPEVLARTDAPSPASTESGVADRREVVVPTDGGRLKPTAWGIGEERHRVKYWYEVLDGLAEAVIKADPQARAALCDPKGSLGRSFSSDPSTLREPHKVAEGVYRNQAISLKWVLSKCGAMLEMTPSLADEFYIVDAQGGRWEWRPLREVVLISKPTAPTERPSE